MKMNRLLSIAGALTAALLLFSCEKTDIPQPKPIVQPDDTGQGGGEVKRATEPGAAPGNPAIRTIPAQASGTRWT